MFVPISDGLLLPRDYYFRVFSVECPTCKAPPMHHCILGFSRDESVMQAHSERHDARAEDTTI